MDNEKRPLLKNRFCCGCLVATGVLALAALTGVITGWFPVDLGAVRFESHSGFAMADPGIKPSNDILDDHHPPYDPAMTELMEGPFGRPVYVNRSTAVFGLDIVNEREDGGSKAAAKLYPDFAAAMRAGLPVLPSLDMLDVYTKQTDDALLAAIETHLHDGGGVYRGGKQGLLKDLLDEVLSAPADDARDEAAAFLAAALDVGGTQVKLPPGLSDEARKVRDRFLENPFNCKPVGIYTQTDTLKQIFQRDRLLQQPFNSRGFTGAAEDGTGAHKYPGRSLGAAIRIAEALDRRPELLAAYGTFLGLGHRLTNPDANLNLRDLLDCKEFFGDEAALMEQLKQSPAMAEVMKSWYLGTGKVGIAVWPFATSKENQLMAGIYQEEDPQGDIMTDLMEAISLGKLDLTPDARSGWYDYQTYTLETLLLPDRAQEARKLLLNARYKVRLRKAFEAMLTQRRETHIKDLAMYASDNACAPPLELKPVISVEPLPTIYLRTARGYRMLEDRLIELLGADELAAAVLADSNDSFLDRTREARAIFTALYLVCCNELGMAPELDPGELTAVDFSHLEHFTAAPPASLVIDDLPGMSPEDAEAVRTACTRGTAWADSLPWSGYMDYDPRVIVPVCSSMDGTYSHYWAVVGVQLAELEIEYAVPPRVISAENRTGNDPAGEISLEDARERLSFDEHQARIDWEPLTIYIPVQVFREVRLKPEPPDREEYRLVCDKGDTADEIVRLLIKEFGP